MPVAATRTAFSTTGLAVALGGCKVHAQSLDLRLLLAPDLGDKTRKSSSHGWLSNYGLYRCCSRSDSSDQSCAIVADLLQQP
eukprot:6153215-Amphidinium_carterae.1